MAEVQQFGKACTVDTAGGARDRAPRAAPFGGDHRRAESTAFGFADYAPATGELRIRHGKGGKEREAYVTNGARELMVAWLGRRGGIGELRCSASATPTRPRYRGEAPYTRKNQLWTRRILPMPAYLQFKALVIAHHAK
jgi:hypothetical protein